jgi:hypothetical protein
MQQVRAWRCLLERQQGSQAAVIWGSAEVEREA